MKKKKRITKIPFPYAETKKHIKELNRLYEKHKLRITVRDMPFPPMVYHIVLVDLSNNESEAGNFFFYPTHKIYELNGNEHKLLGYKFCFVSCLNGFTMTTLKTISLNLEIGLLETGKWLDEVQLKGIEHNLKSDRLLKLMNTLLENSKVKKKYVSSVIGWVSGKKKNGLHHIPIIPPKKYKITCSGDIKKDFEFTILKNLSINEAFHSVRQLLDITNRTTTILLLSFTIVTSLRSLITCQSKKMNLALNLAGGNSKDHEALANLFCNIYNRSEHIHTLDSKLHSTTGSKVRISGKVMRLRDAVFIGKINNRSDIGIYTHLLDQGKIPGGLLLLGSDELNHDFVVDIDMNGNSLNSEILEFHKSNPHVFTTWFKFFLTDIQVTLPDKEWGIGNPKSLNALYDSSFELIYDKNMEFDLNKLRQYAWLLLGYRLFINFGLRNGAITKEDSEITVGEAASIFRQLSAVKTDESSEILEANISKVDALKFLETVVNIIDETSIKKMGNNVPLPKWGWIDESEQKLYLTNEALFNQVKVLLQEKNYKLGAAKSIYEFLYNKGVISKKADKGKGWGVQITGQTKAICYSIPDLKHFLEENECELGYLSTM